MMRLLGLDVGDRRVGVAISDALGLTAQPLEVIRRTGLEKDIGRIVSLIREHGVEQVVVGLPKSLDGSLGPQAHKVQAFVDVLRRNAGVPVVMWDERLTTAQVEKILVDGNVRRERRREVIDKLAASVILNSFMQCRNVRKDN